MINWSKNFGSAIMGVISLLLFFTINSNQNILSGFSAFVFIIAVCFALEKIVLHAQLKAFTLFAINKKNINLSASLLILTFPFDITLCAMGIKLFKIILSISDNLNPPDEIEKFIDDKNSIIKAYSLYYYSKYIDKNYVKKWFEDNYLNKNMEIEKFLLPSFKLVNE